jgi:hypothetical protein
MIHHHICRMIKFAYPFQRNVSVRFLMTSKKMYYIVAAEYKSCLIALVIYCPLYVANNLTKNVTIVRCVFGTLNLKAIHCLSRL